MTRSSHNWNQTPGSFDALHASLLFPTDGNPYGIPKLPHAPLAYLPERLVPYRTRHVIPAAAVHFFLDDYRFETVWSRPRKALEALQAYRTLLTPDFSLYADYPLSLQIWNTYRSRWCGAYWHSLGFQVIPTVSWSTAASYEFCFCGVARHSLVAISTVGLNSETLLPFEQGYREMLRWIQPSRVLCYGTLPDALDGLADVQTYDTRWDTARGAHGR